MAKVKKKTLTTINIGNDVEELEASYIENVATIVLWKTLWLLRS